MLPHSRVLQLLTEFKVHLFLDDGLISLQNRLLQLIELTDWLRRAQKLGFGFARTGSFAATASNLFQESLQGGELRVFISLVFFFTFIGTLASEQFLEDYEGLLETLKVA